MSGLVCCGLQVQLRSHSRQPKCHHELCAGKDLVALPSLLSLAPTPWLSQQGRGASFLPGCQGLRGTTSPGCPCPRSGTHDSPTCPRHAPVGLVSHSLAWLWAPELGPWRWRTCYHFPSLMPGGSNRNWNWGCFLLSHSTFSAWSPASAPFIYSESMSDFLLSNFCLILPLSLQEEVVFLHHYSPPPHSLNENSFTGFPSLAKQREV